MSLDYIEQYDIAELTDGRTAAIVEAYDNDRFIADVGSSSKDWDTISIKITDIKRIVQKIKGDNS